MQSVTIRNAHERPEGIDAGVFISASVNVEHIMESIELALNSDPKLNEVDYHNYKASMDIVKIIHSYIPYVNRVVWKIYMNILLFSDSFYPEKNSAAKLLYDLVMYVSNQQGHNIDVFTISQRRINLDCPKLNIYECILKRHKDKSNLVRGIFELYSGFYFMFLHIRYKFACKHDYILYYNPSVLQIVFLIYLRLVSRKSKFMLILRDVFPDWAIELGIIRSVPVKVFLLFCKKINILLADTIFCESKNKLDLMVSQFPKADQIIIV